MLQIKSVFIKLQRSLVLKTLALSMLLIMSFVVPNSFNAYAVEPCSSSIVNNQDTNYKGPVFLDAYWTDALGVSSTPSGTPIKKEVGPGEGPSTLAVVLVNRSPNDIINVQGVLDLPTGFAIAGTSGDPSTQNIFKTILRTGQTNPAIASYDATVPAGAVFTLLFDINVLNAKVGLNPSSLVVNYYLAGDLQYCSSALLTIPFDLPGKVILDASSTTTSIIPNEPNPLTISLFNKGSADATGVIASIVSLGDSNSRGSSSSSSNLVLQSSTTQLVNLGSNVFNVGTIPAHGKTTINTTVFASGSSSGTTQNVQLQIQYGNSYGYRLTQILLTGLVISPDATTSTLNISYADKNTSPLLTAGKLEDLNFTIANNGTDTLSNIVVSLTPPSSSLSIVGNSKWTIPNLNPGETHELSTKVFAAASMISTPTSFSVGATYNSNGVAKSDSLNLGAYVIGDINIKANDLSVNYVGNTADVVGNLLNQGSTTGLFTNIQLLHPERLVNNTGFNGTPRNGGGSHIFNAAQGEQSRFSQRNNATSSTVPQYIGDLTANSPTPFSIPLPGEINPGIYPVSFKVTYADDLKQFHEVTLNGTLKVSPPPISSDNVRRNAGFGGGMTLFYLPITGASVAAATIFIMKKRNSSKTILKNKKDIDLESLLDDSSGKK